MNKTRLAIHRWLENSNVGYFDIRKDIYHSHSDAPESAPEKIELPNRSNSFAIVVTFNPQKEILSNLKKLMNEFQEVLVVDNSPSSCELLIRNEIPELPATHFLSNGNRNGLSGAINLGIRFWVRSKMTGWLFFYDQDTRLKDHFIASVSEEIVSESNDELWNTLYCTDYADGKIKPIHLPIVKIESLPSLITSGTFFRLEAIKRIGIFIDEMFIDSLDHEFCMRARRFGFTLKIIRKQLMEHSLGELRIHQFFWKKNILTHNHAPFRWYFFTRNFIFSCAENFPSSTGWFFSYGKALMKTYLKVLLFEEQKTRKTLAALLGIMDGILMIFGKVRKSIYFKA